MWLNLHILELKGNYRRNGLDDWPPFYQSEEDSTEHVLVYNKGEKKFSLKDERGKEWGYAVKTYRTNKENKSIVNIRGE